MYKILNLFFVINYHVYFIIVFTQITFYMYNSIYKSFYKHNHYTITIFVNVDFNINYLPLFKRRIRDQFIQEWNTVIASSPKLDYYVKFKETFLLRRLS
jgi:hypothetical protein